MAKTITFDYNNTHYTLEFTRDSIRQLENTGFNIGDVSDKPMTLLPRLFEGAFIAHHRRISKDVVNKIFKAFSDKEKLVDTLAEMYAECLDTLLHDDDEEGSEGKIKWEASE